MDGSCTPKKIKLLITIVNRGLGEKTSEICKENNIIYNIICLGKGTAKSEILDYLGFGETDKDVVLSIVNEEDVQGILKKLNDEMHFSEPNSGIAFTIPLSSVDGSNTLKYICDLFSVGKE